MPLPAYSTLIEQLSFCPGFASASHGVAATALPALRRSQRRHSIESLKAAGVRYLSFHAPGKAAHKGSIVMTVGYHHASDLFASLLAEGSLESFAERLRPRTGADAP